MQTIVTLMMDFGCAMLGIQQPSDLIPLDVFLALSFFIAWDEKKETLWCFKCQVSSWPMQRNQKQPTHEDRERILSCNHSEHAFGELKSYLMMRSHRSLCFLKHEINGVCFSWSSASVLFFRAQGKRGSTLSISCLEHISWIWYEKVLIFFWSMSGIFKYYLNNKQYKYNFYTEQKQNNHSMFPWSCFHGV